MLLLCYAKETGKLYYLAVSLHFRGADLVVDDKLKGNSFKFMVRINFMFGGVDERDFFSVLFQKLLSRYFYFNIFL